MVGALALSFALVVGFALWQGGKGEGEVEILGKVVDGVVVSPESYEVGEVRMKDGIVTKIYEVKNTTENSIRLKKIATSCMCTQAKVKVGEKETRMFGMEGHGDKNPSVNLEIPADETAIVTVEFDPAAHGPQGVGPFDRIVWLTFSDPAGIKELKFNGTVIN